jgi:hypothetical protein
MFFFNISAYTGHTKLLSTCLLVFMKQSCNSVPPIALHFERSAHKADAVSDKHFLSMPQSQTWWPLPPLAHYYILSLIQKWSSPTTHFCTLSVDQASFFIPQHTILIKWSLVLWRHKLPISQLMGYLPWSPAVSISDKFSTNNIFITSHSPQFQPIRSSI